MFESARGYPPGVSHQFGIGDGRIRLDVHRSFIIYRALSRYACACRTFVPRNGLVNRYTSAWKAEDRRCIPLLARIHARLGESLVRAAWRSRELEVLGYQRTLFITRCRECPCTRPRPSRVPNVMLLG